MPRTYSKQVHVPFTNPAVHYDLAPSLTSPVGITSLPYTAKASGKDIEQAWNDFKFKADKKPLLKPRRKENV